MESSANITESYSSAGKGLPTRTISLREPSITYNQQDKEMVVHQQERAKVVGQPKSLVGSQSELPAVVTLIIQDNIDSLSNPVMEQEPGKIVSKPKNVVVGQPKSPSAVSELELLTVVDQSHQDVITSAVISAINNNALEAVTAISQQHPNLSIDSISDPNNPRPQGEMMLWHSGTYFLIVL